MEKANPNDLETKLKELEKNIKDWDLLRFISYLCGPLALLCILVGVFKGAFDLILGGGILICVSYLIHIYPKWLRKKKSKLLMALENVTIELEKEKEIRAKEQEQAASRKLKEQAEQHAHLRTLATDDEWVSFLAGRVCIGMHRDLVDALKGAGYDEKRTVTSKATKLTYKYQPYLNARKTTSYKLQVAFIDDRVNSFKDL